MVIDNQLVDSFKENGFLLIKNFYNKEIIEKLKKEICNICIILAKYNSIELPKDIIVEGNFDDMYKVLCQKNTSFHTTIYDALKNLPTFMQLVSANKNLTLCTQLLNSHSIGVAAKSYGMRIDKPNDEIFRTDWHQDFHTHARAKRGLVFWVPLVETTLEMGALEVLRGTHKLGILNLIDQRNDSFQEGDYTKIANSVKIEGIDKICSENSIVQVPGSPSDLLVFDYNLLHRSGLNESTQCRWSIQIRYFDFEEPWGVERGWPGSITSGKKYEDVIPEFLRKTII